MFLIIAVRVAYYPTGGEKLQARFGDNKIEELRNLGIGELRDLGI